MLAPPPSQDQIEVNSSEHIDSWLRSWDFVANPFTHRQAEGERHRLDRYFVSHSCFKQLRANDASKIVFAPRGGGKSAMRIMLEAECQPRNPTSAVFAVSLTDLAPFLDGPVPLNQLSLKDYVKRIIAQTLSSLLPALAAATPSQVQFENDEIGELRYWINRSVRDPFSFDQLTRLVGSVEPGMDLREQRNVARDIQDPQHWISGASRRLDWLKDLWGRLNTVQEVKPVGATDSDHATMKTFVSSVLFWLGLGPNPCTCFCLLVDGADEHSRTQNDPEVTAQLLKPLLGDISFLEIPNLVVKFFLPAEQRFALERIARKDRLNVVRLTWTQSADDGPDSLRQLLRRRIAAFNEGGLQGLGELCVPAMRRWIEDAMLEKAGASPRDLLHLGYLLLEEHCSRPAGAQSLITPEEWAKTLRRYDALDSSTQAGAPRPLAQTKPASASQPVGPALIRVDTETRRVFRGATEIRDLSPYLYSLIELLYQEPGKIYSKDDIALAVYSSLDVSDQQISRLIHRLREKVEPDPHEPFYVITRKGLGYLLDHAG